MKLIGAERERLYMLPVHKMDPSADPLWCRMMIVHNEAADRV